MFNQTASAMALAARNRARSIAKSLTTDTRIAMHTLFTLTGLALVLELFSAPWGFVQWPVFFLPFLSGLAIAFARSFLPLDVARFWFTLAALPFAAGATALFAWCAQDAAATGIIGWVRVWDNLSVSWSSISLAYASLAALSALTTFALTCLTMVAYREVRPQPLPARP